MSETISTTVTSPVPMIQMFVDQTANEVYAQGRLATRSTEEGIELIAYGNEVLARIDERRHVTIYAGHYGQVSDTVDKHFRRLKAVVDSNEVTASVSEEAPTLGTRAHGASQFIGGYIGLHTPWSAVELSAVEEVNRALQQRMRAIFG